MQRQTKAYIFAGLAVLFWSTVATAFKLALRELDFIQLIFYASVITLILLFAVLLVQQKMAAVFQQSRKQIFNSALLGFFNPLAYYLILFKAYDLLPAQLAQPLNMVWPITLALLSVPLLKQRIGWKSFLALGISFVGVVFIASQGRLGDFSRTNIPGVLLAVGSSLIWALYWIFNARDSRPAVVKLFTNFFFGTVYLLPIMYFFSDFSISAGTGFYATIYIGLFEVGISYLLWMKAMTLSTNNARIGNLVFLAPFISLIFIHLILKETIYSTTFMGLILIVAGIFVQQFDKPRKGSI